MKGFQQKTNSDGMFFTVKHHSIVRESKNPQEGFESIETTNPRTGQRVTKYIQRYDTLEALITKIEWYDTEQDYETRYMGWKIYLEANGKKGVLDIPFKSRVSSRFMKLAENIDFGRPVEFRAWKDSHKDATAFFVGQRVHEEDEKSISVPQKYTRDNPGDCPPPVEKFNGKWNYDDQEEFLHRRMMEVVIPRVEMSNIGRNGHERYAEPDTPADTEAPEETETEKKAAVLKTIKSQLAEVAQENPQQSKVQILEEWFGVSKWGEVEKMPLDLLHVQSKKLNNVLVPF